MTTPPDRELQQWMEAWQTDAGERTAPETIRAHVRRRTIQLSAWLIVEAGICAAALALVIRAASVLDHPVDRSALALLALIAAGALALSLWNWRGMVRASGRTTSAFLALSAERARRLRRGVTLGWGILAAEVLVLAPWVWHRLYGGAAPPTADAERFAWGLLVGLTSLAALFLAGMQIWAGREVARIEGLRRECFPGLD